MVCAVMCVSLTIHRPVPLEQIIHCMLIKIISKKSAGPVEGLILTKIYYKAS